MEMVIEPASKERTEQGEQFIERLLKILQNNDKVTVNVMYCQTCVIDRLVTVESGTSFNAGLSTLTLTSCSFIQNLGRGKKKIVIKVFYHDFH